MVEEPAREWEQELAGIEPLRLEFPYARKRLRKWVPFSVTAAVSALILIPMFLTLREYPGVMAIATPVVVGVSAAGSAVSYFYWKWHKPQVVLFRGLHLHIGRRSPWNAFDQDFDLLSVHDLHLTGPWSRFENKPVNHKTGSPPPWAIPEPFGFSYHDRACSFGGAPSEPQELERVMASIKDYDAAVRSRLGMPSEPGISAVVPSRMAAARENGWDVDVPQAALW